MSCLIPLSTESALNVSSFPCFFDEFWPIDASYEDIIPESVVSDSESWSVPQAFDSIIQPEGTDVRKWDAEQPVSRRRDECTYALLSASFHY